MANHQPPPDFFDDEPTIVSASPFEHLAVDAHAATLFGYEVAEATPHPDPGGARPLTPHEFALPSAPVPGSPPRPKPQPPVSRAAPSIPPVVSIVPQHVYGAPIRPASVQSVGQEGRYLLVPHQQQEVEEPALHVLRPDVSPMQALAQQQAQAQLQQEVQVPIHVAPVQAYQPPPVCQPSQAHAAQAHAAQAHAAQAHAAQAHAAQAHPPAPSYPPAPSLQPARSYPVQAHASAAPAQDFNIWDESPYAEQVQPSRSESGVRPTAAGHAVASHAVSVDPLPTPAPSIAPLHAIPQASGPADALGAAVVGASIPGALGAANPSALDLAAANPLGMGSQEAEQPEGAFAQPTATDEQPRRPSLLKGFIGASLGAIAGACIWGGVGFLTGGWEFKYGAVVIGVLTGASAMKLGRGTSKAMGVIGAAMGLIGILFGKVLFEVLVQPTLTMAQHIAYHTTVYDFIFYAATLAAGFAVASGSGSHLIERARAHIPFLPR